MLDLIILDYSTGEVVITTIPEEYDSECYITEVLHRNIDDCEWMVAEQITVTDDRK